MADAAPELERLIRRMDATDRAVAALQAEQAALREAVQRLSGAPRLWPDSQVRAVLRLVAEDYGIPPRLLVADWRRADMVEARQVAMWIAREGLGLSTGLIGREIGRRDHTTVLRGVQVVAARRAADTAFRGRVERLRLAVLASISSGEGEEA